MEGSLWFPRRYSAQNEHFSFAPAPDEADASDDESKLGASAAPFRQTAVAEATEASPLKVYGPGRVYAETSYRLLHSSGDASGENKQELIELLATTKAPLIFGGKIEEAAAPARRMPGSRSSRGG